MSQFTKRLVAAALDEWEYFDRSVKKLDGTTRVGKVEYQDGVYLRVNDYWKLVHERYKPQYKHLTGRDRGWPWSAAFISFCMDAAKAGDGFKYSAGHAHYINAAIRAMNGNDSGAIYRAHKKNSYTLKEGDMVAYWWGDRRISIDNALQIGWYNSHCDIVTKVSDRSVDVIGGNVMHSVTKKTLRTNQNGELTDTSEKWFVVLECQK